MVDHVEGDPYCCRYYSVDTFLRVVLLTDIVHLLANIGFEQHLI